MIVFPFCFCLCCIVKKQPQKFGRQQFSSARSHRKRKADEVDGVSKKQKKEEDEEKKKLEEQLKVLFFVLAPVF